MGIFNRFLLFVYALLIGISSAVAAGICFRLIPERLWLNELHFGMDRPEVWGVLAAVFLLSLYFLFAVFSTDGKQKAEKTAGDVLLIDGDSGRVRVAVSAVQGLSERVARSVRGVREARATAVPKENGLSIAMRLVVLPGLSAPEIGQSVVSELREEMSRTLNLPSVRVDVSIDDISNAPVDKKQRVV